MNIDKETIDAIEVNISDDVLSTTWDCVADINHNWWLANQMYLKGVHDMAEELRKKVNA